MLEIIAWAYPVVGVATIAGLAIGPEGFASMRDKVTGARFNKEKTVGDMIVRSLQAYPESWSVQETTLRFPLKGNAWKIMLDKENGRWRYATDGEQFVRFSKFYHNRVDEIVKELTLKRKADQLLRILSDESNLRLLT